MQNPILKYILILLCLLTQPVFAKNHYLMLGDKPVIIQKLFGKGKTYVHMHHNETTALKAVRAIIKKQGGTLITLIHSGGRNISFHLDKKCYVFDPNRIFTDRGIKKTLQENSHFTPAAAKQVKKLANKIKALLPKGKIIAVHNNQLYSLKNYFADKSLASDVRALYYNRHKSYHNFLLVTNKRDFLRFKKAGLNTIWQKKNAIDDGSLSVYLAKRNYINIEAGFDQLVEQERMLKIA